MLKAARFSWPLPVIVAVATVSLQNAPSQSSTRGSQAETAVAASASSAPMDTNLFRRIARQQNPVVVAIMTKARLERVEGEEWFEWFFGRPLPPETHVRRGLGSGFLIGSNGEILTNNHVVAGADVIQVGLLGAETTTYRAVVVGRDPFSDSALIRLQNPPGSLAVATLGDSDALEPGDWVMAIGNPFQLGHTVTVGVVSYEGRPFEIEEGQWQKMIQTDASINPGNSGGPLINVRGEVVGINSAMLGSGAGGSLGIGFAVPINSVKTLLPQLRAGRVVRGRIGVHVRQGPISEDDSAALGLPGAAGALITSVERDSPAQRAGLRAGDVVIAFNRAPVVTPADLIPRLSSAPPGSRAAMSVTREGRTVHLEITVEELVVETPTGRDQSAADVRDFGLTLGDITPSIARQLRLPAPMDGAVVYGVEDGSPAGGAGLRRGDVVRRVNRHTIRSAADANQALQSIRPDQPVFFLIWRAGNEVLVEMPRD